MRCVKQSGLQSLVHDATGQITPEPFLLCFSGNSLSTCHRGTNMTEVAQVATVVAHDVDDVTNEDEHSMSDAENKEDDMTHEEEDVVANEDDAAEEEKSEETSHAEDGEPRHVNDGASHETDKAHLNGVEHKEQKEESSEAVNGVEQDAEKKEDEPDTNENQNISDFSLKKQVSEEFKITSDEISFHR